MDMRRHRVGASLPAAGAESNSLADGAPEAADAARADLAAAGSAVAAAAADERAAGGAAAGEKANEVSKELAVIAQEFVPVTVGAKGSGDDLREEAKKPDVKEGSFHTPAEKRKTLSPAEKLQLQKTFGWIHMMKMDKGEEAGKSLMTVPSGPPAAYGPSMQSSLPLSSPEQIAQANDPRYMSPMLPSSSDC